MFFCGFHTPVPEGQQKQTTLRIGTPRATFVNIIGITRVNSVSVVVRNGGDEPAEGIQVTATLPGGQTITLRGPDRLERNKSANYTASCYEAVPNASKVTAKATCSNCRN